MMIPIPMPIQTYSRSTEKIVEVDKHVDTVTVRKSEYDKYKKCWDEMNKFPMNAKYEFVFEQHDPKLRSWGNYIYNFTTDNEEEFLKKIAEVNKDLYNRAIEYDKHIEDYRSVIGKGFRMFQKRFEYLKSKWWFNMFFKEDECERYARNGIMKKW